MASGRSALTRGGGRSQGWVAIWAVLVRVLLGLDVKEKMSVKTA